VVSRTHRDTTRANPATPWVPRSEPSEFLNSRASPDYRALTGDPADSIPGISGIGPKTAARLLAGGAGLEQVPGCPALTGRHRQAITASWDKLLAWREIIRLNDKVPLSEATPAGQATAPLPRAAEILDRLALW
jgi:5'-3' exonuclease